MYLKTVMKLVSLSSTSFSVIPFADFFSRLSQYLASCMGNGDGTGVTVSVCVCVCVCPTHQFRSFADGLGLSVVDYGRQSLSKGQRFLQYTLQSKQTNIITQRIL